MKKPWFHIIEVVEPHGLSLADICRGVAEETGVPYAEIRGQRCNKAVSTARKLFYERARLSRPDLSSSQVAGFVRREGSTIRHFWRLMGERTA